MGKEFRDCKLRVKKSDSSLVNHTEITPVMVDTNRILALVFML